MSKPSKITFEREYRAPSVSILGSLYQRTLVEKVAGMSDGVFLLGIGPIKNASI